jgi:hypothetical protein
MLRIGVLGAGHLGKIHLQCLQRLTDYYSLMGFHDTDPQAASDAALHLGISHYDSYDELLEAVDVVDIVTPTSTHFDLAKKAIQSGKHLFIEKPLTQTPDEARELIQLAQLHKVTVQVGHVERFNPALRSVQHLQLTPLFIEAHRLAHFNPRGTDVPVVLDLMIHDIDIVLHLVKSPVHHISASGVAVVSDTPDIANARIEFANGCIANLTASRISMKQMRKIRLFQKDAYVGLDFLEKNAQILRMSNPDGGNLPPNAFELETPAGTRVISMEMPASAPLNAIEEELRSLAECIRQKAPVPVSLQEGCEALAVACAVMDQIEARLSRS